MSGLYFIPSLTILGLGLAIVAILQHQSGALKEMNSLHPFENKPLARMEGAV